MPNLLQYLVPQDIRNSITRAVQPDIPQKPKIDPDTLGPKEVYISWAAQSRPIRKGLNKRTMKTLAVIGAVIGLLLAIMGEFFLILVVGSIAFISYALTTTSPEHLSYEISNHGIKTGETTYYWPELKSFFIATSSGENVIAVNTVEIFPGRIFLTTNPDNTEKVTEILSGKLAHLRQEPLTVFDKAYQSFVDKFNF